MCDLEKSTDASKYVGGNPVSRFGFHYHQSHILLPTGQILEIELQPMTTISHTRRRASAPTSYVSGQAPSARSSYDELCHTLRETWEPIHTTTPLDTILVPGGLIAGQELGLPLSEIGHDSVWMREYMEESKRRAAAKYEKVKELVRESKQSIALANSIYASRYVHV